jgi:hypothetical protein
LVIEIAVAAQPLLNELLSDDVLDNGYVSEYPVSVTSILT